MSDPIDMSKRHYYAKIGLLGLSNDEDKAGDDQFIGWAKATWQKLLQANGYGYIDITSWDDPTDTPDYLAVLAQAAHDLVAHTLWHTPVLDLERLSIGENVARIPDMPELPEEIQDV